LIIACFYGSGEDGFRDALTIFSVLVDGSSGLKADKYTYSIIISQLSKEHMAAYALQIYFDVLKTANPAFVSEVSTRIVQLLQ
jgi:hypothetical protein